MKLKPEPSSDGEPKDDSEMLDDQGPSFEELMLLVFAGPMRFDDPRENEAADEKVEGEGKGRGPSWQVSD